VYSLRTATEFWQQISLNNWRSSLNRYLRCDLVFLWLSWPRVRLELPRDRLELPRDRLELPRDRLELPRDRLELPRDRLELPRVRLELPRVRLELPQDRLELDRKWFTVTNSCNEMKCFWLEKLMFQSVVKASKIQCSRYSLTRSIIIVVIILR
jgi:hypothetical protein